MNRKSLKETTQSLAERIGRRLVQARQLCKEKGLDWNKAFLKKTTQRRFALGEDEESEPNNPRLGVTVLHISDGKTSMSILARTGYFKSCKNGQKTDTLWVYDELLLDPLSTEERILLAKWWPKRAEDKSLEKKAADILIDRRVTKNFIRFWLGSSDGQSVYNDRSTKWSYRSNPSQPSIDLGIHFSKEGIVSKVSTRKEYPTWIVVKTSNIPYPGYYNILRVKSDGSSGTWREVPSWAHQNSRWGQLSDEDLETIRQYIEDLHEMKLKPQYGDFKTKAGTKVEFNVFDGEQEIKTTLLNHHIDIIDQITNLVRERIDRQTEEKNQQRIKKWLEERKLEKIEQDKKE